MNPLAKAVRRGAVTMLFFALTLGAGAVTAEQAAAALPDSVSEPVAHADRALARARAQLSLHHNGRAVKALLEVKRQVSRANTAAMNQIGKPPTDPESDDIPGPPAVMAVLSLEHRVVKAVVPLFDGQADAQVVDSLVLTLRATQNHRLAMLDKVIALPAEGDFGEYSDLIADKLAIYKQEVTQVTTALAAYTLTPAAHDGLGHALDRAHATQAKVNAAFGGGE